MPAPGFQASLRTSPSVAESRFRTSTKQHLRAPHLLLRTLLVPASGEGPGTAQTIANICRVAVTVLKEPRVTWEPGSGAEPPDLVGPGGIPASVPLSRVTGLGLYRDQPRPRPPAIRTALGKLHDQNSGEQRR